MSGTPLTRVRPAGTNGLSIHSRMALNLVLECASCEHSDRACRRQCTVTEPTDHPYETDSLLPSFLPSSFLLTYFDLPPSLLSIPHHHHHHHPTPTKYPPSPLLRFNHSRPTHALSTPPTEVSRAIQLPLPDRAAETLPDRASRPFIRLHTPKRSTRTACCSCAAWVGGSADLLEL